jgi:hypothetical protein
MRSLHHVRPYPTASQSEALLPFLHVTGDSGRSHSGGGVIAVIDLMNRSVMNNNHVPDAIAVMTTCCAWLSGHYYARNRAINIERALARQTTA